MLSFAQSYPDFSYDPDSGVGPMGNGGDGGHLFTSERDVRRQRRGRHLTKGRSPEESYVVQAEPVQLVRVV